MPVSVTCYTPEGVVLASDSRVMALSRQGSAADVKSGDEIFYSDSGSRLFLAGNKVGIAACDATHIDGTPIGFQLEKFITQHVKDNGARIEDVPALLISTFRPTIEAEKPTFFVAGYNDKKEQFVWRVSPANSQIDRLNARNTHGASFKGVADIIQRLTMPVGELDGNGHLIAVIPHFHFALGAFTLDDAVHFTLFLMQTQINAVRFQARQQSVGGPIDVLVIQPERAFWVQRKESRKA